MKLSPPVKVLLGLGTAWIVISPLIFIAAWFAMVAGVLVAPPTPTNASAWVLLPFFGAFAIQCCTMPVLLVLQTVYLAHIILDRPGSDAVRVLLGLGLFFFPMVAMPLYFLLYIWPGRPPAAAIQPAPLT